MTGTALEAAGEFWHIYRLPVLTIPTNRPCQRQQAADRIFCRRGREVSAIVAEIEKYHTTGRPVLSAREASK